MGAQGPLDGLRSALSVVAASHKMRPVLDIDPAERRLDALTLAAVTPTLVAALHQLQHGREPIEPRPDLGTAANLLWMIGDTELDPARVRALEQYLIATIDHGFNASTFTARVIASTGRRRRRLRGGRGRAPVGSAARGRAQPGARPARRDRHGRPHRRGRGAQARVGERIMGFGHAVYQGERPPLARCCARWRSTRPARGSSWPRPSSERVIELLAERHPERDLRTNVEFYAGVVMESCGLPSSLFTSAFATSRIVGWGAHVLEQADDSAHPPSERPLRRPEAPAPLP